MSKQDDTVFTAPSGQTQPMTKLISHFLERPNSFNSEGWTKLWETNDNNEWDRGFASPALLEFITTNPDILPARHPDGRRTTVFVPGCGRGYDPAMLALHGFDAYGLEISPIGATTAREYAEAQFQRPAAYNFPAGWDGPRAERGAVTIFAGDYFQDAWIGEIPSEDRKFDAVYDYTFLCALHPDLRTSWAKRAAEMVRPGGLLLCLEFPLWKDHSLPGPPWPLRGVYWNLLAQNGNGVDGLEEEEGPAAPDAKFVREMYIVPTRSYEQGRGTDRLSVWRRTET